VKITQQSNISGNSQSWMTFTTKENIRKLRIAAKEEKEKRPPA